MKPLDPLEVWFFTGSQDLYGEAALDQVAADSPQIVAALDAAPAIPVRVVARPVLRSPEGIASAIAEANASDRCIGLIAWMHTFSPAGCGSAGSSRWASRSFICTRSSTATCPGPTSTWTS